MVTEEIYIFAVWILLLYLIIRDETFLFQVKVNNPKRFPANNSFLQYSLRNSAESLGTDGCRRKTGLPRLRIFRKNLKIRIGPQCVLVAYA